MWRHALFVAVLESALHHLHAVRVTLSNVALPRDQHGQEIYTGEVLFHRTIRPNVLESRFNSLHTIQIGSCLVPLAVFSIHPVSPTPLRLPDVHVLFRQSTAVSSMLGLVGPG
eukprot:4467042-Amphidinium_carterae.1